MFCLFTVLVSANLNFGSGYSTIQEHPKPDISAVEISYIILEKEQLQINSEILVCKYCLFKYCQTNFRDGGAISTQIQSSLANCYFQFCYAPCLGGAIFSSCELELTQTIFSVCQAETGSSLESHAGKLEPVSIIQSVSQQAEIKNYGAIHRKFTGLIQTRGTNFTYCNAKDICAGFGYDGPYSTIHTTIFSFCQAKNAPAMALFTSGESVIEKTVIACNFVNFIATPQLVPVPCVALIFGTSSFTIKELTIVKNTPQNQNVLYLRNMKVKLIDCIFDFEQSLLFQEGVQISSNRNPYGIAGELIIARMTDTNLEEIIQNKIRETTPEPIHTQPYPIWLFLFGIVGGMVLMSAFISAPQFCRKKKRNLFQ